MPPPPHALVCLKDPTSLPDALRRPVLAIGNFDGMHRGHRHVLAAAQALAGQRPCGMLTFEPHPRQFFQGSDSVFRLTPSSVKAALAALLGLHLIVEMTFDGTLASRTAEEFVDAILVRELDIAGIVVGHDFHFGKGRGGSPAYLLEAGKRHGFEVSVVEPLAEGGVPISSSAIRRILEAGNIVEANTLLGHEWFVRAEVIHGDKRGRVMGYPTANLRLDPTCRLRFGIYAVRITIDGVEHGAVASYGRRPTFDNGAALLEVHVFDFAGDLYGKTVDVTFVNWIRGEAKFDSVPALIVQMDADSARAREMLAG